MSSFRAAVVPGLFPVVVEFRVASLPAHCQSTQHFIVYLFGAGNLSPSCSRNCQTED